jgi:hypothetical protein
MTVNSHFQISNEQCRSLQVRKDMYVLNSNYVNLKTLPVVKSVLQTSNFETQTQDSKLRTQNPKLKTQNRLPYLCP